MFHCPSCAAKVVRSDTARCGACGSQFDLDVVDRLAVLHRQRADIDREARQLHRRVLSRPPERLPAVAVGRAAGAFLAERKLATFATVAGLIAAVELLITGWGPASLLARLVVIVTVTAALSGIAVALERSAWPVFAAASWSLAVAVLTWIVPVAVPQLGASTAGLLLVVPTVLAAAAVRRGAALATLPLALLITVLGVPVAFSLSELAGAAALPAVAAVFAAICGWTVRRWGHRLRWVRPWLWAGAAGWVAVLWSSATLAPAAAAGGWAALLVGAVLSVRRSGPAALPVAWRASAAGTLLVALGIVAGDAPPGRAGTVALACGAFATAALTVQLLPVDVRARAGSFALLPAVVLWATVANQLDVSVDGGGTWGGPAIAAVTATAASVAVAAGAWRGRAATRLGATVGMLGAGTGVWWLAAAGVWAAGVSATWTRPSRRWVTVCRQLGWAPVWVAIAGAAAVTTPAGWLIAAAGGVLVPVAVRAGVGLRPAAAGMVTAAAPVVVVMTLGSQYGVEVGVVAALAALVPVTVATVAGLACWSRPAAAGADVVALPALTYAVVNAPWPWTVWTLTVTGVGMACRVATASSGDPAWTRHVRAVLRRSTPSRATRAGDRHACGLPDGR